MDLPDNLSPTENPHMEELKQRIIELEREVLLQREVILAISDELDAIHKILKLQEIEK